jgi:hypothetical protein
VGAIRRATLRLSLSCDNHCVFCAQRGLVGADVTPAELPARLAELRRTADALTFVGGEPTLFAGLADAVAAARAAGFVAVGLQTHARHLAGRDLAARLVRAGLTDVHVSVHGASAAVHDYHTGSDGSFAGLWAGVAAARALGATVVASTVLTRSSFRALAELPALLSARGVAAWQLVVPRVAGDAASGFDRVVPRLGMALPFALHALDAAVKRRLPAFIRGAPLCALGSFAAWSLSEEGESPRAYAGVCDGCGARRLCDGVDAAYLQRWGAAELTPREPPSSQAQHALAALFVGTGELAPPAPAAARPKHALPLLGKVQPARGEVTAATPKKSGEALREILPELFKPVDKPATKP